MVKFEKLFQILFLLSIISLIKGSTDCNPGYYNKGGSCYKCARGQYSPDGKGCLFCPAGSFSSSEGQSSCYQCKAGTYSSTPGASYCTDCSVGYYSGVGSSQCSACIPGTHTQYIRSTFCYRCPIGTYNNQFGRDL